MSKGKLKITYHMKERGSHFKNIQVTENRSWALGRQETILEAAMRLTPARGVEWVAVADENNAWSFKVADLDHIQVEVA